MAQLWPKKDIKSNKNIKPLGDRFFQEVVSARVYNWNVIAVLWFGSWNIDTFWQHQGTNNWILFVTKWIRQIQINLCFLLWPRTDSDQSLFSLLSTDEKKRFLAVLSNHYIDDMLYLVSQYQKKCRCYIMLRTHNQRCLLHLWREAYVIIEHSYIQVYILQQGHTM